MNMNEAAENPLPRCVYNGKRQFRRSSQQGELIEERMALNSDVPYHKDNGCLDVHIEMSAQRAAELDTRETKKTLLENTTKLYNWCLLKFKKVLPVLLFVGFLVYVGFAIYLNPERAVFICVVTPLLLYIFLNNLTHGKLTRLVGKSWKVTRKCLQPSKKVSIWARRLTTIAAVLGIMVFLVIDIWDQWEKWTPLGGLAFFTLVTVIFSKKPSKINWIPVIWGIILQFCLGLIILRWRPGYEACQWVGSQLTMFLGYTDKGSEFVFGEKYTDHPVVFKILPVVMFVGAVVSILYYVGAMQLIIKAIAVVLQYALGTTPIESFATAAHIFIGQVASSLVLKPFWIKLTESELHAILTSGYATVAGTVIAAYIEFGVPAEHVISASFMSAPAALALAKISIPETETPQIKTQKDIRLPTGQETNAIEALSVGATSAIKLIAYVVANLIAFVSILAFFDAVISYLGSLVNYPQLSFQLICSYIFMPLAAVMGVPWAESHIVGALIGKKIILNEFLAYIDLGALIKDGTLQDRSVVLATYILCGFGSIAALGINLGSLTSAAPEKRSDFARLSLRSMIHGNIACFMTACVAEDNNNFMMGLGLLLPSGENVSILLKPLFNSISGLLYQAPTTAEIMASAWNHTISNSTSVMNATASTFL